MSLRTNFGSLLHTSQENRNWLWASLAFWTCVLQLQPFLSAFAGSPEIMPDYFQDWASARNRLHGLPIYTRHDQSMPLYLGELSTMRRPLVQVNAHPPSSVLLGIPLANVEFHTALVVWNTVSLLMLLASIAIVARELGASPTWWSLGPFVTLFITCGPVREELRMGQLGLFLALLITNAWAAERNGKDWLAGICWVLHQWSNFIRDFSSSIFCVVGDGRFARGLSHPHR